MRALICGAGIAGLTLTCLLDRMGWEVQLVERASSLRREGYMIDFFGPGERADEVTPALTDGTRCYRLDKRLQTTSGRSPVLTQVAEGVLVHQSELLQNNAVVVQGRAGVLLIDPGIQGSEMACLANDLRELGQPVVAGFSTHPDWDHVLWYAELGEAPRYGTARCAAYHARSAVERGLEGPRRRGVTAGNRRGDTAGPVRPHYRSACRNCADSLGWP